MSFYKRNFEMIVLNRDFARKDLNNVEADSAYKFEKKVLATQIQYQAKNISMITFLNKRAKHNDCCNRFKWGESLS